MPGPVRAYQLVHTFVATWVILLFIRKGARGQEKEACKGKILLNKRKIAGLMFPILTDSVFFSPFQKQVL